MTTSKKIILATTFIIISLILTLTIVYLGQKPYASSDPIIFDPLRAFSDLEYQVSLGPRTIGSDAHQKTIDWITTEMKNNGWATEIQEEVWNGKIIKNIISKKYRGTPWIVLGAHYDSRFISDRDTDLNLRDQPVPGANDGASGVAVLLELARVLPKHLDKEIWIVFFDAEDNGNYEDWEWAVGSKVFVNNLQDTPDAAVIVSMIGDSDLNINKEKNSDVGLTDEIWEIANQLGYYQFIPEYKHQIIDDHIPFIQAGIPAVDIIDIDYLYWHTTQDTVDKVSPASLQAVGDTLLHWLLGK